MAKTVRAWHWTNGAKLRGGAPLKAGAIYRNPLDARGNPGPVVLCERGYHGSRNIIDSLEYICGNTLSRTEHRGEIVEGCDKLASSEVKVLWALDCARLLRVFACDCAERALKRERVAGKEPDARSWEAIRVSRAYADSKATNEELAAARNAAWAAARNAAGAVAWAAARDAAWAAAWAATRDAECKWQERHLLALIAKARKAQ